MLIERVDAKPGEPGDLEREVRLEVFFVVAALRIAHDAGDEVAHRRVTERRGLDAPQVAVDPDHRRKPGREMQVGRCVVHRELEQLADVHSSVLSPGNIAVSVTGLQTQHV